MYKGKTEEVLVTEAKERFKDITQDTLDTLRKILQRIVKKDYARFDMDLAELDDDVFTDVVGRGLYSGVYVETRRCMKQWQKSSYIKFRLYTDIAVTTKLFADVEACLRTDGHHAYLIAQPPHGSGVGEVVVLIGYDREDESEDQPKKAINTTPQETSYEAYGPQDIPMLLGNHVKILIAYIDEMMYTQVDSFTFGDDGSVKFTTLLKEQGNLPPQVIKVLEETFLQKGWDVAKYVTENDNDGCTIPTKEFILEMKGTIK